MLLALMLGAALTEGGSPRFDGRLLAVADADMAATAYADGRLEPLPADQTDTLILIEQDGAKPGVSGTAHAPNSVMSWPQIVEVLGHRAYVVETRGAPDRSVTRVSSAYDQMPPGRLLSAFDIDGQDLTPAWTIDVGTNPQSVSRGPNGWLLIATEDAGAEAVFVRPGAQGADLRPVDLDLVWRQGGENQLRGLFWSPDGRLAAANLENERLQVFAITRDTRGNPSGLEPASDPVEIGSRWTVAKWTPDSRTLLAADTNWGSGRGPGMLVQGPGSLVSVRVGVNGSARIVSRVRTGLSPEGFGLSSDGRRAVVVNMGRTYLPANPLLRFWPGWGRSSLRLVGVDLDTGALSVQGREVFFDGVLPEDAVFDADGDMVAVAVFQRRHGEERRQGSIDFWRVKEVDDGVRLVPTGQRVRSVRGPHDLVLVD